MFGLGDNVANDPFGPWFHGDSELTQPHRAQRSEGHTRLPSHQISQLYGTSQILDQKRPNVLGAMGDTPAYEKYVENLVNDSGNRTQNNCWMTESRSSQHRSDFSEYAPSLYRPQPSLIPNNSYNGGNVVNNNFVLGVQWEHSMMFGRVGCHNQVVQPFSYTAQDSKPTQEQALRMGNLGPVSAASKTERPGKGRKPKCKTLTRTHNAAVGFKPVEIGQPTPGQYMKNGLIAGPKPSPPWRRRRSKEIMSNWSKPSTPYSIVTGRSTHLEGAVRLETGLRCSDTTNSMAFSVGAQQSATPMNTYNAAAHNPETSYSATTSTGFPQYSGMPEAAPQSNEAPATLQHPLPLNPQLPQMPYLSNVNEPQTPVFKCHQHNVDHDCFASQANPAHYIHIIFSDHKCMSWDKSIQGLFIELGPHISQCHMKMAFIEEQLKGTGFGIARGAHGTVFIQRVEETSICSLPGAPRMAQSLANVGGNMSVVEQGVDTATIDPAVLHWPGGAYTF